MKTIIITVIISIAFTGCAHQDHNAHSQEELVTLTFNDVTASDIIKMHYRMGKSLVLPDGGLSMEDLSKIRFSVNKRQCKWPQGEGLPMDLMKEILAGAGLSVEELDGDLRGYIRIKRKEKTE